jgi:DNA replication protein DnaC
MTTPPKDDRCFGCGADAMPEWIPPLALAGRTLAGTGEWRSQITDGLCPSCHADAEMKMEERRRRHTLRLRLIALGGGEKPCREFRFDTFEVTARNRLAFLRASGFNPLRDNLYLWGACGVGKTHLAFAMARRFCEEGQSVEFLRPPELMRKVRRRDPDEEQRAIDRFVRSNVFVLDDLGIGTDTAYARQIFQEILDGRDFAYRAGLVVTSKYSLGHLATKLDDDTIVSRLAGMCRVIEIGGTDHRLKRRQRPLTPNSEVGGS